MSSSRVVRGAIGPTTWPSLAELATPPERRDRAAGEGFEAGYAAGLAAARAETRASSAEAAQVAEWGRNRVLALTSSLEAAVEEASAAAARAAVETVGDVGAVACALAEAILQRELRHDPAPVLEAVDRALAVAPEGPATVLVHPGDLDAVATGASGTGRVVYQGDASVERGGCVLRSGATTVDARVGTAIARVRSALAEAR